MTAPNPPPTSSLFRVLGIVGGVLVALLVAWLFLRKSLTWSSWIHDIGQREVRKQLLDESDPALVDKLDAALRDDDLPRTTRVAVGGLLIDKNRLALVERAAEDASLDVRTIALEVLARMPFFRTQYADDPKFRFQATMVAWLKDGARTDRAQAIAIVPQLVPYESALPDDLRAALRALATPASPPALRHTAAASLGGYRDCDAASAILEMALAEEAPDAKLRLMQTVVLQFWDAGGDDCRKRLPEEKVRALVTRGLSHPGDGDANRAVRIGALGLLSRHPEWAKENADVTRGIFEGTSHHEVERRSALEALVAAEDAKTIARFPAYFHDPSGGVRSSAVNAARVDRAGGKLGLSQLALTALVAGYFSFETDVKGYEAPMRLAYAEIRQKAGTWVGMPEPFRSRGGSMAEIAGVVHTLLETGSFEGVTRAQIAESLFRWLAEDAKLNPVEVDAAVRARTDFWEKAKSGDAAGARAIYDASVAPKVDLWTYERGWLVARGAI